MAPQADHHMFTCGSGKKNEGIYAYLDT